MIQSILFDKNFWTIKQAIMWLESNGYVHKKVHETDKFYRFRQLSPSYDTYRYITKKIPNHIELIVGYPINEF